MAAIHLAEIISNNQDKLLQKLAYIAKYDGRTTEQEIELMVNEWIRAFEEVCGKITID